MNEEEKEAIEILEAFEPDDIVECALYRRSITETKNYIEKLQKELDKKDKVNNYIFEYLTDTEWDNCCFECEQLHNCPQDYDALLECIKEYFYKEVEKENE